MAKDQDPILQEVSNEIKALLGAGDTDKTYLASTKRIHQIAKAVADRVCHEVDVTIVDAALVVRCIARKTDEALAALIELVERDHAYAAATMLRQMCEELLFAKFIRSLPRDDADEFVRLRTALEGHEGIEAQEDFFTAQQKVYGVTDASDPRVTVRMPDSARGIGDELRSKLKDLGKRVGWGNKPKPTVKQMAERSGSTDVYDFFYHASSSSVHASLHHLLRMVWFDQATKLASVTNTNFQQYYRRFALVYGSWIAGEVMAVVTQEFPGSLPKELEQPFNIWLALTVIPAVTHRAPPIVTREEIRR